MKRVKEFAAKFGLKVDRRDDGYFVLLDPEGKVINTSYAASAESGVKMIQRHLGQTAHARELWITRAVWTLAERLNAQIPARLEVALAEQTGLRDGGHLHVAIALTREEDVLKAILPHACKLLGVQVPKGRDALVKRLARELGDYPDHYEAAGKANTWVRLRSVKDEDYTALVSPQKLELVGPPRDPWGKPMVPKWWRLSG